MRSPATITIDSKRSTTKQELITADIKLVIEQLEAGHSEALTKYLTAMSRFHKYSFGNVLEIARQMPTATRVAGFSERHSQKQRFWTRGPYGPLDSLQMAHAESFFLR